MTDIDSLDIKSARVGIIGVGNMGEALLTALLNAGADRTKINFAVRRPERSVIISEKYGIAPATIEVMATNSDVLMIIVKPKDLDTVMTQIKPTLKPGSLIISFLAAKKIATLESGLGNPAVARSYGFVRSRDGTWHVQTPCLRGRTIPH